MLPGVRKEGRKKNLTLIFLSTSLDTVFMKAFSSPPEFSVRIANEMQILVYVYIYIYIYIYICHYHRPSAYCASETLIYLRSSENVRRYSGLTKISYVICTY